MAFEHQYLDKSAHFIAGGRTLEIIKKYEYDQEHWKEAYAAIAKEFGANELHGNRFLPFFLFDNPVSNPALDAGEADKTRDGKTVYLYKVNPDTPEGKALMQRIGDIPKNELGFHLFAKKLTGQENTPVNPDNLEDPQAAKPNAYYPHPNYANTEYDAAIYRKYGDTYVVSTPLVVRGIFNDAAKKEAEGYTYEWFTPPDSEQIPYSKVVEIREKALGDQLKPQVSTQAVGAFPTRRAATAKMGG